MSNKIMAILAAIIVIAAGSAVFVFGGLEGSSSSSSTVYKTSAYDADDSETDDSDSWTSTAGSTTAVDSVSGLTITYVSGPEGCYSTVLNSNGEYTVTFSGITEDSVYLVSGTLNGNIVVEVDEAYDFKLGLNGITITSAYSAPIVCNSANNFHLAAIRDTSNTVTDSRSEQTSDTAINSSIYSACDMKLKGYGTLTLISKNNNGIHSKDDLRIRNLTLSVTCVDNALKGNDSVYIKSGNITLNATSGDGIVTNASDLSESGVQRGTVTVNTVQGDTVLNIYAYCDGIDAAYDVIIEETDGNSLSVTIKTYTGASTSSSSSSYSWGGNQRGPSWGAGGIDSEGNSNKSTVSTKGIKANNSVNINSGTVTVNSYDDAIHANSDVVIESTSKYGSGAVNITGGTVTLSSSDDGIHADGTLTVSGGTLVVSSSYEALEGSYITISGGKVSLRSTDDGINAVNTITLSGGYVYVYAGGDGVDSNCSTSYKGINFCGADVIIVSTSGGNSAIDTDRGYTYTSGHVLAICPSGMANEVRLCSSSNYTFKRSVSYSAGSVIGASVSGSVTLAVKMPVSVSGVAIYLGSNSATIGSVSASGLTEVFSGVYF